MKALLLGYGEIGKGVYEILSPYHEIEIEDREKGKYAINVVSDLLLIAVPWSPKFKNDVITWQLRTDAKATIVFSTVPIGTCHFLDACHFPIEAKHPHISRDIRLNGNHWLGGDDPVAIEFLKQAGLKFQILENPDYTEFLKLRSTAIYGLNIEFARYSAEVAKEIGLDYSIVKQYDLFHNVLVQRRGTPEHTRYILDPPEGNIGGHCVVPNAKILDDRYPSMFLKEIYRDKEGKEDAIPE